MQYLGNDTRSADIVMRDRKFTYANVIPAVFYVRYHCHRYKCVENGSFLDPEGSLSATTVVVLVLLGMYPFSINASSFVNTQRKVTKLRIYTVFQKTKPPNFGSNFVKS